MQHAALQDRDRVGELEVVDVAEHDDVGGAVDGEDRVHEVVDDLRLLVPLHLADPRRRLEATEQRIVAALGVEVVGDHEHGLAAVGELAGQRLAAGVPRGVGRIDPTGAERQLRAGRAGDDAGRCRRRSARTVDEGEPAVGAEQEADPDVPAGLPAVLVVDRVDLAPVVRRAAGRGDRGDQLRPA